MRYPKSATADACSDEIQTLERTIRRCAPTDQMNPHDDGLVRKGKVPLQYHLFPNDGGLALRDECAVGTVRKRGEGLDKGSVGRIELLLCEGVIGVAVGVELIAASAKVGRG
jgi:hypothetical protein